MKRLDTIMGRRLNVVVFVCNVPYVLSVLEEAYDDVDYRLTISASSKDIYKTLLSTQVDLIITDFMMCDDEDGDVLARIKEYSPDTTIMVLLYQDDVDLILDKGREYGACEEPVYTGWF